MVEVKTVRRDPSPFIVPLMGLAGTLGFLGIGPVGSRLDDHQRRISACEAALRELGVGPPIGWIDEIEAWRATTDGRIGTLEVQVGDVTVRIEGLERKTQNVQGKIGDVQGELTSLSRTLEALRAKLTTEQERIGRHESDIGDLYSRLRSVGEELIDVGNKFIDIGREIELKVLIPDWFRAFAGKFTSVGNELREIGEKLR